MPCRCRACRCTVPPTEAVYRGPVHVRGFAFGSVYFSHRILTLCVVCAGLYERDWAWTLRPSEGFWMNPPKLAQDRRECRGCGRPLFRPAASKRSALVCSELGKFRSRVDEEAKRLDKQRRQLDEAITTEAAAGAKLSDARVMEWRAMLRGLPHDELITTLRDAAAGQVPASEEIMATVASCPSPLLLGLGAQDALLFSTTIAEYRALAGPEMLELGSLDQVLADAETAAAWLEGYAAELVGANRTSARPAPRPPAIGLWRR
jgi:hypothetical protein